MEEEIFDIGDYVEVSNIDKKYIGYIVVKNDYEV